MGKKAVKKSPDRFVIAVIIISAVLILASIASLASRNRTYAVKENTADSNSRASIPAEIASLQNETLYSMLMRDAQAMNSTIACYATHGCAPKVESYCKDGKTACVYITLNKCENPGTPEAKCAGNRTGRCFACNRSCSKNYCT